MTKHLNVQTTIALSPEEMVEMLQSVIEDIEAGARLGYPVRINEYGDEEQVGYWSVLS